MKPIQREWLITLLGGLEYLAGGNKIFSAEEIKRGSKNSALKGGYDKKWGWANKNFWCQGYQQIVFDFQKNTTAPTLT